MRLRFSLLAAALLLGSALANLAPPQTDPGEAIALLEGGWRYDAMGAVPPDCDQPPAETGQTLIFEFAATGGKIAWLTPDGDPMALGVTISQPGPDRVAMITPDGPAFIFRVDGETLVGEDMPDFAGVLKGKTFRKCYPAADRTKINLTHDKPPLPMGDLAYLSKGTLGEQPRFVDTRFNKSPYEVCTEPVAQYLFFDLVGPLGFSMGRWNTAQLAEHLANGGTPKVQPDDVSNWTIEAVEPVENGWKVTATELIPPNGSRGDTTSFTVLTKENAMWIPEWKREYWRCTTGEETTRVSE